MTSNITPINSKKAPSFGMNITRSTVKLLKQNAYEFAKDETEIAIVKSAVKKLADVRLREDGLTLNLKPAQQNKSLMAIEPYVKSKDLNKFYSMDGLVPKRKCVYNPSENKTFGQFFSDFVDSVTSDTFARNSNSRLKAIKLLNQMDGVDEKTIRAVAACKKGFSKFMRGTLIFLSDTVEVISDKSKDAIAEIFYTGERPRRIIASKNLKNYISDCFAPRRKA